MQYLDYRKKLGIGLSNKQLEERFLQCMENQLKYSPDAEDFPDCIPDEMLFEYCNIVGADYYYTESIIEDITDEHSVLEFLAKYSVMLHLLKRDSSAYQYYSALLRNGLDVCHIQYELVEDDDGLFVFPKGAAELDNALITEPLVWLSEYPQAKKTFITALKQYSEGQYVRDTADNLRKALEEFLREFLGNTKQLEANKSEIGRYLGSQNVGAEFTSLFQTVIQTYKLINDAYAKHHDKVEPKLLEFLLYQTGLLIRMVLSVKQAEMEVVTNAD